jgi:cytochrome b involved in lipid metabolism
MDSKKLKEYSLQDCRYYNGEYGKRLWVPINGNIYDLTDFDHPGGMSVLRQSERNYRDLGNEFIMTGHSASAKVQMKKYLIGILRNRSYHQ